METIQCVAKPVQPVTVIKSESIKVAISKGTIAVVDGTIAAVENGERR